MRSPDRVPDWPASQRRVTVFRQAAAGVAADSQAVAAIAQPAASRGRYSRSEPPGSGQYKPLKALPSRKAAARRQAVDSGAGAPLL